MHADDKKVKVVIYYSVSDFFLGAALIILVVFFINDNLSHALIEENGNASLYMDEGLNDQTQVNSLEM